MNIAIIFEGYHLELPADLSISYEDENNVFITDTATPKINFPFSIPNTAHNRKVLGFPDVIANVKLFRDSLGTATLILGGDIFNRYNLYVLQVNADEISISLNEGNNLYNSVSKLNLRELGLPIIDPVNFFTYMTAAINGTVDNYPITFAPYENDERPSPLIDLINAYDYANQDWFESAVLANPDQYGITPFVYLKYIIDLIYETKSKLNHVGFFQSEDIKTALIYNPAVKPFNLTSATQRLFDLKQHVPDMTVADFLQSLKNTFLLGYYFDETQPNQIVVKAFRDMLDTREATDLTDYVVSSPQLFYDELNPDGYLFKQTIDNNDKLHVISSKSSYTYGNGENVIDKIAGDLNTIDHYYSGVTGSGPYITVPWTKQAIDDIIFADNSVTLPLYNTTSFTLRLLFYRLCVDGTSVLPAATSLTEFFTGPDREYKMEMDDSATSINNIFYKKFVDFMSQTKMVQYNLLIPAEVYKNCKLYTPIKIREHYYLIKKRRFEASVKSRYIAAQLELYKI
jgi:hypothetical protein